MRYILIAFSLFLLTACCSNTTATIEVDDTPNSAWVSESMSECEFKATVVSDMLGAATVEVRHPDGNVNTMALVRGSRQLLIRNENAKLYIELTSVTDEGQYDIANISIERVCSK